MKDKGIRQARIEDLPTALSIVHCATRRMEELDIHQWDEVYPSELILRTDIEQRNMYVLEEEGMVLGIITLNEQQSPEYQQVSWEFPGRVLVVHRLTVHPEHQRKRIGSRLLAFAEQEFARGRYEVIRLDAYQLNPAAAWLYKKWGYRNAGMVRFRKGVFCCYEKRVQMDQASEAEPKGGYRMRR